MVCDKVHAAVVAQRQRGLVQNAQQQLPQGVGGLFDLVEKQEAQLHLVRVILGKLFLRDQRMRFAVAQVARRRADQLGDFVGVLELRAVHLDHRARIAEQDLSRGFHDARLARAGGAEEQQVPYGPAGRAHSGAEDLIQVHHRADGFFLPDDLVAQGGLEFLRLHAAKRGIELTACGWLVRMAATLLPASVTAPR